MSALVVLFKRPNLQLRRLKRHSPVRTCLRSLLWKIGNNTSASEYNFQTRWTSQEPVCVVANDWPCWLVKSIPLTLNAQSVARKLLSIKGYLSELGIVNKRLRRSNSVSILHRTQLSPFTFISQHTYCKYKYMGMSVPAPSTDPTDPTALASAQALSLMTLKSNIEAELETHFSVLRSNSVTMRTPLVDTEGFPRADIDIVEVRTARVRIIELRNDLDDVMKRIGEALEGVYDPRLTVGKGGEAQRQAEIKPFARVESVAASSPAADANLLKDDLVVKFGRLDRASFRGSLQPLAEIVAENEGRAIPIRILRDGRTEILTLTPRRNWGGRGMLGCLIVPYTIS